jgi:hypothetical protein
MSQLGHPLGLRLQISTLWITPVDLFSLHLNYDYQFYLQRWLEGFFEKNYFYFFELRFLHQKRFFNYLSVSFYSAKTFSVKSREKKIVLRNAFFPPSKKDIFTRRYTKLKLLSFMLRKVSYSPTLPLRRYFFAPLHKKLFLNPWHQRLKNVPKIFTGSRDTNSDILVKILARYRLLRLKFYLENYLGKLLDKHLLFFLMNLGDLLIWEKPKFIKKNKIFGINATLQNNSWSFFQSLQRFKLIATRFVSDLVFLAAIFSNTYVATQWLYFSLSRVKKHHVSLSHRIYLNFFVKALENLVYFTGVLRGFYLTVRGKIGGSSRTKQQKFLGGLVYSPQKLALAFSYTLKHVPTFAGVLGLRLWFIY